MPTFSQYSQDNLATTHFELQRVFNEVIKHYDCRVMCGERGKAAQDAAFAEGRSKVEYPNSKHNHSPSLAVDVAPYPIDWEDVERFRRFAWFVKGVACAMGIKLRLGADWDGDNDIKDQNFHDIVHFELIPNDL